jgi:hypothetical protein
MVGLPKGLLSNIITEINNADAEMSRILFNICSQSFSKVFIALNQPHTCDM